MEPNFLGPEAVRLIKSCMESYLPTGDLRSPLSHVRTTGNLRTICFNYLRSLGMVYPRMSADEKMDLCRLMVKKKTKI